MADADRLARIEAHLELLNLEGEYSRTWDIADGDGWAALYTEDGVFELLPTSGGGRAFWVEGRERLAAFCHDFNRGTEGLHLLHTPSFSIDGERARSWIHFEFRSRRGESGETGLVAGIYNVSYLRTDAGWRIRHRVEQGVLRSRDAFTGVPREVETQGRPRA